MAKLQKAVAPFAPKEKTEVLRRLKTARGHLDGVIGMVEQDVYCLEILKQLSAVRSALDRVGRLELQHHLEHCFLHAVHSGKERDAVTELMETLAYDKEIV
jgi:CsoR family transcriptional regulator, copper-sensing transcriptional repressor